MSADELAKPDSYRLDKIGKVKELRNPDVRYGIDVVQTDMYRVDTPLLPLLLSSTRRRDAPPLTLKISSNLSPPLRPSGSQDQVPCRPPLLLGGDLTSNRVPLDLLRTPCNV